jgi:hypothetical protein
VIIIFTKVENHSHQLYGHCDCLDWCRVQKCSDAFERVQCVRGKANAELDHRSSSTNTLNPELDRSPVHEKSGSNRGSELNVRITIGQGTELRRQEHGNNV